MSSPTDDRYAREIASVHQELTELQESSRIVMGPEELTELELEIRGLTERLAAALLG